MTQNNFIGKRILMQGFLGDGIPFTYRANPSATPHIRFKFSTKIDILTLCLAYLRPLLIL